MRENTSTILAVTQAAITAEGISRVLETHCEVLCATGTSDAESLILTERPDLVLLDSAINGADAVAFCRRLTTEPATRDVPVIALTERRDSVLEDQVLAAGAVDFVSKPLSDSVLASRVLTHLMLKAHRDAHEQGHSIDGLTGIANVRRANQVIDDEWRRNTRDRRSLALLAIEVDELAPLNEAYGRVVGDKCLRRVARCLSRTLHRSGDLVARTGGAQFLGILPRADDVGAEVVADRVRRAVTDLAIPNVRSRVAPWVTVSIGVAAILPAMGEHPSALRDLAEHRLAEATRSGRDRWIGSPTRRSAARRSTPVATPMSGMAREDFAGSLLVVDDTRTNLEMLSGLLATTDCEVRVASSGAEALAAVQAKRPDLVLLDISMPDLDGYDVCRRLKADPATVDLPVIFISAHDQPMDKVRAFEVGGADYVQKPFQPGEVLARIAHQLKITRLQNEMRMAHQRLLELDRLKATITAMLVHDLRSPLTVVLMAISALRENDADLAEDERTEMTEAASAGLQKVLRLVEDMLEVYRSESGSGTFPLEEIDPAPVISRALAFVRMEARQRELDVAAVIDTALPRIRSNTDKLDRALANLLSNAAKFTPKGGRIVVTARGAGEPDAHGGQPYLRIEIADNGQGIPADELPFIFEPYRQATSKERKLGVGLGLAIVKRVVEGHNGTISVESELGRGTRFTIEIPAVPARPGAPDHGVSADREEATR